MSPRAKPLSPCVSLLREQPSHCILCPIRASALFANLKKTELDQRLKGIHNGIVRAGTVIYRRGEPAETIFTIRSGVVKLVCEDADCQPRIVRMLGRGSAIGLESLDSSAYEQTAIAMRDLNLCRIPRSSLTELGDSHPGLFSGIVKKWREHVYWSDRWISSLCAGKQSDRVPSLICMIAEVSGDPLRAVRLPRSAEMAEILGCSVESLSRRMAGLKREGLLRRIGPWTYSCDPALLEAATRPQSVDI
jgi:CRP-like cAMP-binding protein